MEKKSIKLNDLFEEQSIVKQLVTIEKIQDSEDKVKITPWSDGKGCNCELALIIPISSIDNIYKTEYRHTCCGKNLIVVEIEIKEKATISVVEIFDQQIEKFNNSQKGNEHVEHNHHQEPAFGNSTHNNSNEEYIEYDNNIGDVEYHENLRSCPQGYRRVTCNGRSFCVTGSGRCCGTKWCASDSTCRTCGNRSFCAVGNGTCCGTKWCPQGTHCKNGKCYWN